MQREGLNNTIYSVVHDYVPASELIKKNKSRTWVYGYNDKHDLVVISKTGQIGQIINISGFFIALPEEPFKFAQPESIKAKQFWRREEIPKELSKINSIFQWNEMPPQFKDRWIDYIEQQFDYREIGRAHV